VSILTSVNASSERKSLQMRSHKWRRMFAEVRPNFGRIVTCCRAEPSRTFGWIIRPNYSAELFGRTLASAELRRLPNFGPSLMAMIRLSITVISSLLCKIS